MDGKVLALLLLGIVLVSGCTEPLDKEAETVKASTTAWLGSEQGMSRFPEGILGEPIRVWNEGETLYWIVPIKNIGGLYIGNLVTTRENFTSPRQIIEYGEPIEKIMNTTRDEAHQQMIAENDYPAYQISRPILLTIPGEGLFWYSEVKANNEVLDELYIVTFTF